MSAIPRYTTNAQDQHFEDLLFQCNLTICNSTEPTWHRGTLKGINNDVCARGLGIKLCRVLTMDSHSKHSFLRVETSRIEVRHKEERYRTNVTKLSSNIANLAIALPYLPTTNEIEIVTKKYFSFPKKKYQYLFLILSLMKFEEIVS